MGRNPSITWHATRFQIVTGLQRGHTLVDFANDGSDTGLYMRHFRNNFGTSLACRGPHSEITRMIKEILPRCLT